MSNLHLAWARLFVRALVHSGVRACVVSPGSRSTPLALAVAAEPGLVCHVVVDERSAAFFALGHARVTGQPCALLCTSGTAAAHYAPAVIEASLGDVPLILVTADRPWDAQECGASQTVDQVKLFGSHVRHFADLGLPDATILAAVSRIAAQAVLHARHPRPGPVHVNARFRKPLEPVATAHPEPWHAEVEALLAMGAPRLHLPGTMPDSHGLTALADACRSAHAGLIVCGPAPVSSDDATLRTALAQLYRATGFPILAEATSQVRFGTAVPVVGEFDTLLRNKTFAAAHKADLILQLGATPVSAAYAEMLAHYTGAHWLIAPHGWPDPSGTATDLLLARPVAAVAALAACLTPRKHSAWARDWHAAAAKASAAAQHARAAAQQASEGDVAVAVVDALPAGAVLAIGNSGPVRDLDTFVPAGARPLRVLHQRGAAGIDGLVSAAAGAAVADGGPVALILGDVSLLHDLGGLAAARTVTSPLAIVVVHNDGGRIFEQLPLGRLAALAPEVERLFVTPHGLQFGAAAALFGLRHFRVETRADLHVAVQHALGQPGATLVEVIVPPRAALAIRHQAWEAA